MSRRRRRHDTAWMPLLLIGLTALFSALRDRRGSAFGSRDTGSPLKPVFTLVGLIAAFVALGVLLTVLSAVAALGGGGALTVVCGVPLMLVGFVAWMIARSKHLQAQAEQDPWTINGTASEVGQGSQDATPNAAAKQVVPPMAQTTTEAPAAPRRAPAHQEPSRHAGKTAAKVQALPERPPRSPAEYRQRSASYRRKIQSLIRMRRPGPISERMTGVLEKLKSWEERVGQLADRLTLYERDDLIQRDVRETPMHIERLRRQLALEAEPEMQRQVQRTLAAYEEQQRQLELLAKAMKRTRLNLDDTLAAMGTVYSQLQVLNAMDIDGPTATRIAGDVDREVERLNDLMAAVSDVYRQDSETLQPPAVAGAGDEDAGLSERKARLEDAGGK